MLTAVSLLPKLLIEICHFTNYGPFLMNEGKVQDYM